MAIEGPEAWLLATAEQAHKLRQAIERLERAAQTAANHLEWELHAAGVLQAASKLSAWLDREAELSTWHAYRLEMPPGTKLTLREAAAHVLPGGVVDAVEQLAAAAEAIAAAGSGSAWATNVADEATLDSCLAAVVKYDMAVGPIIRAASAEAVKVEAVKVEAVKVEAVQGTARPPKGKPGRKADYDLTVWLPRYEDYQREKTRAGMTIAQYAARNKLDVAEVLAAFCAARGKKSRTNKRR